MEILYRLFQGIATVKPVQWIAKPPTLLAYFCNGYLSLLYFGGESIMSIESWKIHDSWHCAVSECEVIVGPWQMSLKMRMFVCADSFTPPTILAIKLIALFRLALTTHHLGYSATTRENTRHSIVASRLDSRTLATL